MSSMKNMRAIIRTERLSDLLRALKEAEVNRVYVTRTHAFGAGVDPMDFRLSMDEGDAFSEKTQVEFLCQTDRLEELVDLLRTCAETGHRGDGVIIVTDVSEVVSVRTGGRGRVALI